MPEIAVSDLRKSFRAEPALDGVTFDVLEGEFLTLLGPSGCGKTTTLMSIAGFQRPDSGTITVGGRAFVDTAASVNVAAEDRNLGMVFQSYAIWPHMTVARNVGFPLRVRRVPKRQIRERVVQTLDLVEMGDYAGRYPHELSGGQQQRVALARALVHRPSVLLLDEPFSSLDAKLRERARIWLKNLQAELALTTIFVTHDQQEALSMSDRIVVMDRGRIQQAGTPEEVYRRPNSRFVADFLGQCNILTGRAAGSPQNGTTRLALDPAAAPLTVSGDVPAAGTVEVAVRPEAIELGESASGGVNVSAARVRSAVFLGDHYRYELDAGGLSLVATSPRRFAGPQLWVRIPPAACWILGRDETPADTRAAADLTL